MTNFTQPLTLLTRPAETLGEHRYQCGVGSALPNQRRVERRQRKGNACLRVITIEILGYDQRDRFANEHRDETREPLDARRQSHRSVEQVVLVLQA